MSKQHPNLNYEFYFLFRIEFDYANEHWLEPPSLLTDFATKTLESRQIDQDKRLFRYIPPFSKTGAVSPLEDWEQHLQQGWAQILASYTNAFQRITDAHTSENPRFDKKMGFFKPLQTFMGVALLIMDDSLDDHQIKLNTNFGEMIFKPSTSKTPSEKLLLKITEASGELMEEMNKPAIFEEFERQHDPSTALDSWQIQLDVTQPPFLTLMQAGENHPNPVFIVYGLAHGRLPDEAVWPSQLRAFLCQSPAAAVMARILPRLILQKWQFQRLNMAARHLRQWLDTKNEFYQKTNDARLECASNPQLEQDLRDMNQMSAEAKKFLAQLDVGTKTLEFNQRQLKKHLQRSGETWQSLDETSKKYQWQLIWQHESDTPLLDGFKLDKRLFHNHASYLKNCLTYLDDLRSRWQLHLDGRRLAYEFNIQIAVLVLTFIVALTGVIALMTQLPEHAALFVRWLSSEPVQLIQTGEPILIGVNLFILVVAILLFIYMGLKSLWRRLRCVGLQLRKRFF